MEPQLLIPASIMDHLPAMVRNELATLSPQQQSEFLDEFRRQRKSIGAAYAFWFFFAVHYGYLRQWANQLLFWFTCGGMFVWTGLVRDFNRDVAIEVLRNMKSIAFKTA